MKNKKIAVIGGGLAGLTAAIHLASKGFQTIVFEKKSYPHHKVCGEYLSREVIPYLISLGVDLDTLKPISINKLLYSTPSGKVIKTELPLGGIGISRYALDNFLYIKAKDLGVSVFNETVTEVLFKDDKHNIITDNSSYTTDIVLGAYGKRSILDKKLERDFIAKQNGWLAVKGHYDHKNYPKETVSLHNFKGGYCGLSRTETGAVNVCYLATYNSFKKFKDPEVYKEEVLCKNEHLKKFFNNSAPLFNKEITIAQISFDEKSLINDHILMLGDAAALIHPLCGNGMAMAIHSGKLAAETIIKHLASRKFSRSKLENHYLESWRKNFSKRIRTGRILQKILLSPSLAEISQTAIKFFPGVLPQIIKRTHGTTVL